MAVQILSTGFALILAGLCGFLAWRAGANAERAHESLRSAQRLEGRLLSMRGEITGHGAAIDNLDTRVRRLNGRVDALRREEKPVIEGVIETPDEVRQRLREAHGLTKLRGAAAAADGSE